MNNINIYFFIYQIISNIIMFIYTKLRFQICFKIYMQYYKTSNSNIINSGEFNSRLVGNSRQVPFPKLLNYI